MKSAFREVLMFGLFISLVFLISCGNGSIPSGQSCDIDEDCVPAACCHPTEAVNKEYAPDCSKIMCTMECVPDTLDCGQGEIKCVEGMCKAVLNS